MHSVQYWLLAMLPVHASQSQVNVRILKQHPREEVLLSGMNQEWCIYDLHTHTRISTEPQCGPHVT